MDNDKSRQYLQEMFASHAEQVYQERLEEHLSKHPLNTERDFMDRFSAELESGMHRSVELGENGDKLYHTIKAIQDIIAVKRGQTLSMSGSEQWLADPRLIRPSYDLFNGKCFEHVTFREYANLFDRSIPPGVQLSYLKPAGQKIFTYFLMKIAVSNKDGVERFNIPSFKNQKNRVKNGESKSRNEAVMQNEVDRFLKKHTPSKL